MTSAPTASRGGADEIDAQGNKLVAHTLRGNGADASEDGTGRGTPSLTRTAHAPAVAFHTTQDPIFGDTVPAMGRKDRGLGLGLGSTVRRLMPVECERLMGMPDGYTEVDGAADGPRYAAIGNSIAVPVLSWIGRRIETVERT